MNTLIEINPSTQRLTGSVIFLHGLGADGNDFVPVAKALDVSDPLGVRFVFPSAPFRPITINQGYVMRAWYDLYNRSNEIDARVDLTGIQESVETVHALIEKEAERGITTEQVILAGFSQGAVIALTAGLLYPKPLRGILALSGYFPFAENVLKKSSSVHKNMPIFIGHGTQDNIVPYTLGFRVYETLKQHDYSVELFTYPMAHSVCVEEIKEMRGWLERVMGR